MENKKCPQTGEKCMLNCFFNCKYNGKMVIDLNLLLHTPPTELPNNAIKFGRWLLKYAIAQDVGNGLCYSYENQEYNTAELYDIFIQLTEHRQAGN